MNLFFNYLCISCTFVALCLEAPVMASWSTPSTLTSYANEASDPVVAVNSTGYAIAVWSESNGQNFKIRSAVRPEATGWTTPVDLSQEGEDAFSPSVAMNAAGNTVVVWQAYDGESSMIHVKLRAFGGAWSDVITISDPFTNSVNPQVTMDSIGNIVVVWEANDGQGVSIQSITRSYNGFWTYPTTISGLGQFAFQPQVASTSAGDIVAVWTGFDGYNLYIEASTLQNGFWSYPSYLSDYGYDAINPSIAISTGGDAVAVWSGFDGYNFTVQSSVKFNYSDWGYPMYLSEYGQDAYSPKVAMDGAGNAVVVWTRNDGNNFIVQSSSLFINYSASSESLFWTDPVNLSDGGVDATGTTVTMDPWGNAVAAWTVVSGANFVLQAAQLPFGSSWSSSVEVSDSTLEAVTPYLAIDPSGNAIIVWAEHYNTYVIQSSDGTDLFW